MTTTTNSYVPCLASGYTPQELAQINNGGLTSKGFFVDQTSVLATQALSFLASFAVNSFVQSLISLIVPNQSGSKWEAIAYNILYVVVVVALAIALMYPIAKAKAKRDQAAKSADRLLPVLVRGVNFGLCPIDSPYGISLVK